MRTYEGNMSADGLRVALVAARFNGFIVDQLVAGALDALRRHGVHEEDLDLVRVPGTFELPAAVRRVAELGRHDAIVALGAVVRGATPHFDYVAGECAKGLGQLALEGRCAIGFGVLTTDNLEQAIERAGTKTGNKGADAALAAIEQANLFRALGPNAASRRAKRG
ncbi:MAG: 6,7-dimethyl-8-ribityllumazine synthase [Deltaproteobacteria bacterium]